MRPRLYETQTFVSRPAWAGEPHPLTRAELLDPSSSLWQPANPLLALFPDDLFHLLAQLAEQSIDERFTGEQRTSARRDHRRLLTAYRRYTKRRINSGRVRGRPPKLTDAERESMSDQDNAVRQRIQTALGGGRATHAR